MNRTGIAVVTITLSATAACTPLQTQRPAQVSWLDQGWSPQDRRFFYHATQGSMLIPYRWMLSVEQGKTDKLFIDPDNLARLGFLADKERDNNPDELPVGFSKTIAQSRSGGGATEYFGFTCATCHTGQIKYEDHTLRIDGGPAMIDLPAFFEELFGALAATRRDPVKFGRFAHRVLGRADDANSRKRLYLELSGAVQKVLAPGLSGLWHLLHETPAGFGRLDALNTANGLLWGSFDRRNIVAADAPVSYPHLWSTPRFDWAQLNASIEQPMARNIGEALGVNATVKLTGDPSELFESSVDVVNLYHLEGKLQMLKPPIWPQSILPKIDAAKAQSGKAVYNELCASCHDPRPVPPMGGGPTLLRVVTMDVEDIGTDPRHARDFAERKIYGVAAEPIPAAELLQLVTEKVKERKYREIPVPEADRPAWDGFRPNTWRAETIYRARPLDGIWATGPYLHNGSVPNLYQLLLPVSQRDTVFYTGTRRFDPVHVGYETARRPGTFELRTDVAGNANTGHECRDVKGPGVICRGLTDAERWALVEYLKTL